MDPSAQPHAQPPHPSGMAAAAAPLALTPPSTAPTARPSNPTAGTPSRQLHPEVARNATVHDLTSHRTTHYTRPPTAVRPGFNKAAKPADPLRGGKPRPVTVTATGTRGITPLNKLPQNGVTASSSNGKTFGFLGPSTTPSRPPITGSGVTMPSPRPVDTQNQVSSGSNAVRSPYSAYSNAAGVVKSIGLNGGQRKDDISASDGLPSPTPKKKIVVWAAPPTAAPTINTTTTNPTTNTIPTSNTPAPTNPKPNVPVPSRLHGTEAILERIAAARERVPGSSEESSEESSSDDDGLDSAQGIGNEGRPSMKDVFSALLASDPGGVPISAPAAAASATPPPAVPNVASDAQPTPPARDAPSDAPKGNAAPVVSAPSSSLAISAPSDASAVPGPSTSARTAPSLTLAAPSATPSSNVLPSATPSTNAQPMTTDPPASASSESKKHPGGPPWKYHALVEEELVNGEWRRVGEVEGTHVEGTPVPLSASLEHEGSERGSQPSARGSRGRGMGGRRRGSGNTHRLISQCVEISKDPARSERELCAALGDTFREELQIEARQHQLLLRLAGISISMGMAAEQVKQMLLRARDTRLAGRARIPGTNKHVIGVNATDIIQVTKDLVDRNAGPATPTTVTATVGIKAESAEKGSVERDSARRETSKRQVSLKRKVIIEHSDASIDNLRPVTRRRYFDDDDDSDIITSEEDLRPRKRAKSNGRAAAITASHRQPERSPMDQLMIQSFRNFSENAPDALAAGQEMNLRLGRDLNGSYYFTHTVHTDHPPISERKDGSTVHSSHNGYRLSPITLGRLDDLLAMGLPGPTVPAVPESAGPGIAVVPPLSSTAASPAVPPTSPGPVILDKETNLDVASTSIATSTDVGSPSCSTAPKSSVIGAPGPGVTPPPAPATDNSAGPAASKNVTKPAGLSGVPATVVNSPRIADTIGQNLIALEGTSIPVSGSNQSIVPTITADVRLSTSLASDAIPPSG